MYYAMPYHAILHVTYLNTGRERRHFEYALARTGAYDEASILSDLRYSTVQFYLTVPSPITVRAPVSPRP